MRAACSALLLFALATQVTAATTPFLAEVKSGDPDSNQSLQTLHGAVAFLDANGNGKPDASVPDEPVYLDLDGSNSVSYGDLRLTGYGPLASGTVVGVTDSDAGRALDLLPNAWFSTAGTTWILDVDGSRTISAPDIRFGDAPTRIGSTDSGLGQSLSRPASAQVGSLGFVGSGPRDILGVVYVDLDSLTSGGGRATIGDLRLHPAGFAAPASSVNPSDPSASDGRLAPAQDAGFRLLDGILVVLSLLNLAGLLFVVRSVNQLRGPPKNPFK